MFARSPSTPRATRTRSLLSGLSLVAVAGIALASIGATPSTQVAAEPAALQRQNIPAQELAAVTGEAAPIVRSTVVVESPTPTPTPTPTATAEQAAQAGTQSAPSIALPQVADPNPGSAQALAQQMVAARGWGGDQYGCLYRLWQRESNWNVYAQNPSSGAYGIPQSLPGSKMATVAGDWRTNPATQITWGLNYIAGRYGTPCSAWGHSEAVGWY